MNRFETPLSLLFMMYNEEDNIAACLDENLAYARQRLTDWEIVVVDDGSTDRSAEIVEEYAAAEPRIRLLTHSVNRGMGAGMATGLAAARKEYFIHNSVDLQHSVENLDRMLPKLKNADIVLTTHIRREDSVARRVMSKGLRAFMRATADIDFRLEGLYLYPTAVGQELLPKITAQTFFFSFELIARGIERGLTTTTIPIKCRPRHAGSSKVANLRRIRSVGAEVLDYRRRRQQERGAEE